MLLSEAGKGGERGGLNTCEGLGDGVSCQWKSRVGIWEQVESPPR